MANGIPILSDIFGSKPQIAPYVPTDFTQEQLLALQENIGAFPDITQLGNLYEQYMLGQFQEAGFPLESLVAGGVGLTQQEMGQAGQELAGQIPADVQAQVERSSAYQSLLSGTAGSPMSGALTARDLGLTSLDLINQGAALTAEAGNSAQRWQNIAGAATMNPASMFVSPQQRAALDMQNRLYQQATQQLQYNVNAAPSPVAKGLSDIVENLTAAYLGSMGGGGARGGGGSQGSYAAGNAAAESAAQPSWMTNLAQGTGAAGAAAPTTSPVYTPQPVGQDPSAPGFSLAGSYTPPPNTDFTTAFWNASPYLNQQYPGQPAYTPFGFGTNAFGG